MSIMANLISVVAIPDPAVIPLVTTTQSDTAEPTLRTLLMRYVAMERRTIHIGYPSLTACRTKCLC